jgi:hypothetical protein
MAVIGEPAQALTPVVIFSVHDSIDHFLIRLYAFALGRHPDTDGLRHWRGILAGGASGGSVAYNFIFSHELTSRNLCDSSFLDVLYITMLGRHADADGKAYWMDKLASGVARTSIFCGFDYSTEFVGLCVSMGIPHPAAPNSGSVRVPVSNIHLVNVWNMIAYANLPGISDSPEHIAGIIGNLQSEAGPALCPFQIQVSNHVGLGLMQWSFGRRTALENFMWSRGIDRDEFYTEMNKHLHSYTCNPSENHPQPLLNNVLQAQIDFMAHEFRNTSERAYMNFIEHPESKTGVEGARAYAELFCALSLRPPNGGVNDTFLDPGVQRAILESSWPARTTACSLNVRRNRAATVYHFYLAHR